VGFGSALHQNGSGLAYGEQEEEKDKKRKSTLQISYPQFPFGELWLSLREQGKEEKQ